MSVLVLFSGGVDSTVLLTKAIVEGRLGVALWYRYPHPAAAAEYRSHVEIRRHFEAAGFPVPAAEVHPTVFGLDAMDTGAGEPGPRVVPARNQVFVSIAVSMAAARGFDEVWLGAQAEDASDYPDCRPGWVEDMDRLAQAWGVRVRAPLLGLSRAEVRALGNRIGAPLDLCSSCYQPDAGAPCGACNSCLQDAPAQVGGPISLLAGDVIVWNSDHKTIAHAQPGWRPEPPAVVRPPLQIERNGRVIWRKEAP